jgi:hypothetical protein
MSPESILEKVYILAVVRRNRIEFYEVPKDEVQLLEIDRDDYDIDIRKDLIELATTKGQLVAIIAYDRIAEEGEE